MAVEAYKSAEVTKQTSIPRVMLSTDEIGIIHYQKFTFTQTPNAGDIGSTADLVIMPAGRFRILPHLSRIAWSAFGASRTLNVGHTGYTKSDGTVVAAVPAALLSGEDVSAAGGKTFTQNLDDGVFIEDALGVVLIQAIVAGGTIPLNATLKGHLAYVRD